ncbi:unnamed protein product [Alopecurus aequalis]
MELLLPLLLACSLLFPLAMTSKEVCDSQTNDFQHLNSTGVHFTLHHPRSPCSPTPLPSDLPFSAIIAHDAARIARLTLTTKTPSSLHDDNNLADSLTATVPLSPRHSVDAGNYVTQLGFGTPATLYTMVIDTGSSLTWLQCSPCEVFCNRQTGPIFDPQASSTYASVPCSAPQCAELVDATNSPSGCSDSNVCKYHSGYGDKSFSSGYLGKDTVSLGSSSFPAFYYGCGQDNKGFVDSRAGMIGLSKSKLSLFNQLAPSLGSSFSYCLPTSASAGYLSIGPYNPGLYSYTPMLSSSVNPVLYFVGIAGMSVGGRPLAVSSSAYRSLPTIIDSGTVITRLPPAVYTALSKAVASAMAGTPRAPAAGILDTCFQGQASDLHMPTVDLTFSGGLTLQLVSGNVLYDLDGSTTCLAFAASKSRIAVIGNTQQQTFNVVYDVTQSRIGFAAGGCS